jgi:3-hydroxyacyl-CoA dehydrogenase
MVTRKPPVSPEAPSTTTMPDPSDLIDSAVAVVGCGLIGAGWVALFKAAGLEVRAFDPDTERLGSLEARVAPLLEALATLGPVADGRLILAPSLAEAVGPAALVQENAPERIDLKRRLFAEIEAAAPADALIASSTTALLWSAMAAGMRHPDRLVVAHPFNPVHLIPLVELFTPDNAVAGQAAAFYRALGKHPVRLQREMEGHIAGRLASALWREAVHLAASGVASVADIDAALTQGPGLRWAVQGAHIAYHTGGGPGGMADYLTHLGASQERRWATLGAPSLDAASREVLIKGVAAEAGGRSVADLEAERDRALLALLRARRGS